VNNSHVGEYFIKNSKYNHIALMTALVFFSRNMNTLISP